MFTPYPSPQEAMLAATTGFQLISSRTVQTNQPLFAKCVAVTACFGLSLKYGEPNPTFGASDAAFDLKPLYDFADALDDFDPPAYGAADATTIDPATLLLIQLAVELFREWRKRRNP